MEVSKIDLSKLSPEDLIIAAHCGHPEAAKITGLNPPADMNQFLQHLLNWYHEARVTAAYISFDEILKSNYPPRTSMDAPSAVFKAVKEWLNSPNEETLKEVVRRTNHCEVVWNDISGNDGSKAPYLCGATYLGWAVMHPNEKYNAFHSINSINEVIQNLREKVQGELLNWISRKYEK